MNDTRQGLFMREEKQLGVGGAKGEGDKEMNVIKVLYVHV
jgi:hypothetical protein